MTRSREEVTETTSGRTEDPSEKSPRAETLPREPEKIVREVRERYAEIARRSSDGCCAPSGEVSCCAAPERIGYAREDLDAVPAGANLGLGCGAPIRHLALQKGETVLDLGSGAGFDALLAAPHVGNGGRVIGVDMTPEMISRARENARKASYSHVEFRQGRLEALPVEDDSVDAVTSNCVINLVPDKGAVFREIARVLRPGGRLVVSDILLESELPEPLRRDLPAYVGCVAGAMTKETYLETLRSAGLSEIEILEDLDFLAAVEESLPEEIVALMQRTGVRIEEVQGKVRSVTYRAVRPGR